MASIAEAADQARGDGGNRKSLLKVVLAILMAAEAVGAILFTIGKTSADVSLTGIAGEFNVHYSLPFALAGDAMLGIPMCALTLVATVTLWQDGWGRARLIGPRKRAAVWGALLLQVVVVSWSLFLTARTATQAISPGLVIPVLVVGGGTAWVVRRPPYTDIRRAVVVALIAVLGVVGMVGVLSFRYTADVGATTLVRSMERAFGQHLWPTEDVVCKGYVSADCARRAARRAGRTVAWLSLPRSRDLVMLAQPGNPYASEQTYFPTRFMGLDLTSPPHDPVVTGGHPVRTVTANGITTQLWRMDEGGAGFLRIDWGYEGQTYEMSAFTIMRAPSLADIDMFVRLWGSVAYRQPG